jgi:thioesterase domain-containing protein
MTLVPLTQATLRLGIDLKTLRRWLSDAQLPLQSDPQDARKKGVRVEHLHLLAHRHQRCLVPASPEPCAQESASSVPLPAAVLALPEMLSALQAQITALQQQVATLTQRLEQSLAAAPEKTRQRSAKAIPPAPKAPPVAKAPRKPAHVIPRVEYRADGGYVVICPKKGLLPICPDTQEWFAWVKEQDSFRFVGTMGHFTAHHEWRVPKGAWRAHRHIRNHNYIQRLAPYHELTIAVLEQAAQALQAHLV